ncbi:uncharacterized protein LOC117899410 [Drosophila subobscura]|uniref:uncharacterized protein LOC117899410 n=1 Tax=Drosophila subobscura TaxID=7241 RepID=UPI00155A85CF|nr:uncharacterized protein LOC117899410 [Drosophila subobscura]
MDTRFHFKYQSRQPRLRVESNPAVNYYPDSKQMSTVCRDKSTIIGTDRVTNYLKEHIYQKPHGRRILYNQLRANDTLHTMLMFCHMPTVIPVRAFLDCMIMRHMMMESMVPKYPYHQKQSKL